MLIFTSKNKAGHRSIRVVQVTKTPASAYGNGFKRSGFLPLQVTALSVPLRLFSCIVVVLLMALATNRGEAGIIRLSTTPTVNGNRTLYQLYAEFDSQDIVTAATDFQYVSGGTPTFYHADALNGGVESNVAGTWNPQFLLVPGANDSFVLIGGGTGFASGNSTAANPNWGGAGFNQASIPSVTPGSEGPGWFNNNLPNEQGKSVYDADGDVYKTRLGQFVLETTDAASNSYILSLKVTSTDASGQNLTTSGDLTFTLGMSSPPNQSVPEPSSGILMGLLGVASFARRFRRQVAIA